MKKKAAKPEPTRRAVFGHVGGAGLIGVFAGAHQFDQGSENTQRDQPGEPVIDAHIHVVPPRLPGIKPMPKDVDELYKGPLAGLAERLKNEMQGASIKVAFGMGSLSGPDDDPLGVAATLELSRFVPGLKAIGAVDPRRTGPAHLKAVETQIERDRQRIVAFKAYLGYLHFGPEDPNYARYYALAAKYRLPVIFHTGDNWSTKAKLKYAHPLRIDEVAVDFPEVRFVMAHFGNPWLTDAAEVIFKNPNVWADLSGLFVGSDKDLQDLLAAAKMPDTAPGLAFADLKKAMGYVDDFSRFIHGSDWPLAPMAGYRRLIAEIVPK